MKIALIRNGVVENIIVGSLLLRGQEARIAALEDRL